MWVINSQLLTDPGIRFGVDGHVLRNQRPVRELRFPVEGALQMRRVLLVFIAAKRYFCFDSWYSISVLTAQRFDLSVTPAAMLSTAVIAVSIE